MRAIQHPSNNRVLGAPKGWDQDELPCNAIALTERTYNGVDMVVTYWRPSPEERAAIANGYDVCLTVVGTNMPPVAIGVEPKP